MNNKPIAWMDDLSFFTKKPEDMEGVIPLYTHPHPDNLGLAESIIKQQQAEIEALKAHPVKELNDGGEPVKNATYWKRQYNLMATQNDNLKSGLYHANEQIKYLESHPAELTDEEIIESLAELEHEQWMKWADTIMQTEKISDVRFARWASCMISYAELTEEMKEFDREWARKALAILRKASEK